VAGTLAAVAERAWAGRTPGERALRAALVPAAVAYGAVTSLRNRLYDARWLAVTRVPARVLSVGNITVGGTGKTPAALWLAERLAARGWRPAIVARGYGKRRRGVVVVGEDGRALVTPEDGGDEAVLLARRFAGPVVTGERRAEAAAFACARFGVDAIVLDDGFQHRALARDADLVLTTEDTAAGWPLPAGPLREPAAGLGRARALLAVDGPPPPDRGVPVFRGRLVPTGVVAPGSATPAALATLAGRTVTALAGVARPARFVATLEDAGIRVGRLLRYPDHHPYGAADAVDIARALAQGPVVTTEKDVVKLERFPGLAGLAAVRVALEVERGEALVDLLAGTPQVDLHHD
jgi:tetraacyldisaccharide 4'-kinase